MRNHTSQMCVFPFPLRVEGKEGGKYTDRDGIPMKAFYIDVIILPQVGPD